MLRLQTTVSTASTVINWLDESNCRVAAHENNKDRGRIAHATTVASGGSRGLRNYLMVGKQHCGSTKF